MELLPDLINGLSGIDGPAGQIATLAVIIVFAAAGALGYIRKTGSGPAAGAAAADPEILAQVVIVAGLLVQISDRLQAIERGQVRTQDGISRLDDTIERTSDRIIRSRGPSVT